MESVTAGTVVGAGSFRCTRCGYTLTLMGSDMLTVCPDCASRNFERAPLFHTELISADAGASAEGTLLVQPDPDLEERLARARDQVEQPGEYLCYEEGDELRMVALTREWTRIGRSLAADVRFDDPTVSRRHALVVRHADGVRLLDDRSLNGVFVNGERVDGKTLQDGDEIVVGRYHLGFMSVAADRHALGAGALPASLHSVV